jgi:hypothetical protein
MNSCNYNTKFKSISNISEDLLLNILESNFKMFFDWSFLHIGGWFDATRSNTSTIYGSSNPFCKLLLQNDPSYISGQVWQGIRKDWVWESDICYNSGNPINVSGCYINDAFVPYDPQIFTINYPEGKLIFNGPQSKNAKIEVEHSYRYVQVYRSSDSPWFNKLQYSSLDNSSKDIQQLNNGEWSISGEHRIQLPAIVIESVPRSRSRPYELGNNNLWLEQDIMFYVLAENKNDRNKLLDILRLQQDLNIQLYNTNNLAQDNNYPLNYLGDKNNSLTYPDIISQYAWRLCFLKNISLFEMETINPNLFQGAARCTVEIISE